MRDEERETRYGMRVTKRSPYYYSCLLFSFSLTQSERAVRIPHLHKPASFPTARHERDRESLLCQTCLYRRGDSRYLVPRFWNDDSIETCSSYPAYSNLQTLFASRISLLASFHYAIGNLLIDSFCELIQLVMKLIFHVIISTTLVFDNWIIPKAIYQLKFSYKFYRFFLINHFNKVNSQCRPN